MLPSHLVPGLEALRAVNLPWLVAAALACQFAAIVVFVEKLKAVDLGMGRTALERDYRAREERRRRAAYGLFIDLSLYLLAIEIVLAFIVLGK